MKTSTAIVLALGVLTTSSAVAGKPRQATKLSPMAEFKKPKLGESYDLRRLDRRVTLPTEASDTIVIVTRGLTQAQVGMVVKDKHDDVEYCWQRLPVFDRMPSTAMLQFTIEDTGSVAAIKVGGDAPTEVNKCLAAAAAHWAFPVSETRSTINFPVALRSL